MKETKRTASGSNRATNWLMRLGVMVLVVGVAAFGFIYYQDQHVDAGPSLLERQIAGAEAAVKKTPNDIGARLQLATAYRSVKRTDDALKQYDEILKAEVDHRPALLGRGSLLMAKGDLNDAAVAYKRITGKAVKGEFAAQDPQLAEAHYFLGSIAVTQGKTKVAIAELESALRIDRTDSDALYLLGVARLKGGEPQLAIDAFESALMFVPTGWCEPYAQLGAAYVKLGRAPKAEYSGAMLDFCQNRPADAKRRLTALKAGPVAVDAMLGLGLIAETASDRSEATSWYKKVLTVDSANISAISSLSRLGVRPDGSTKTQGPKS